MVAGMEQFSTTTDNPFSGVTNVDDLPFVVPDERVAARIDASEFSGRKLAAARAHPTQIPPTSWLFSMATGHGDEFMGFEHFELVAGTRGPAGAVNGWEDDLFAGLPL